MEIKNSTVSVLERIQAGDVFLLKYRCPKCNQDDLSAYPLEECGVCKSNLSQYELNIKHSRLLSGTSRRLGKVPKYIINQLRAVQGESCAYCFESTTGKLSHVEHIVPLCVGGTNNLKNLCLSCPPCNLAAGKRVFNTFDGKREFIRKKRHLL